MGVSFN